MYSDSGASKLNGFLNPEKSLSANTETCVSCCVELILDMHSELVQWLQTYLPMESPRMIKAKLKGWKNLATEEMFEKCLQTVWFDQGYQGRNS